MPKHLMSLHIDVDVLVCKLETRIQPGHHGRGYAVQFSNLSQLVDGVSRGVFPGGIQFPTHLLAEPHALRLQGSNPIEEFNLRFRRRRCEGRFL